MRSRIDVFNAGFESEEKTIEGLEGRVRVQRVKAAKLGERLEEVRRRVKGWERMEGEWQAKTSRRLRILWGALLSVAILLLVLHYRPGHLLDSQSSLDHHNTLPVEGKSVAKESSLHPPRLSEHSAVRRMGQMSQEHTAEIFSREQPIQHHSDHLDKTTSSCPDAAERTLRLFDEL